MPKGIPLQPRIPKDLQAAEAGYNAFYDEQPQVFFNALNHAYQMRWVRAARAVMQMGQRQKWRDVKRQRTQKTKEN